VYFVYVPSFCAVLRCADRLSVVIYAIALTLLFFAGRATGRRPSFGLCLAQAALIYALPLLIGFASFSLVLHVRLAIILMLIDAEHANQIWLDHRAALTGQSGEKHKIRDAGVRNLMSHISDIRL
jgi:hypothetical protein